MSGRKSDTAVRKPLRVLIVDDEALARQRLEDLLRDAADVEIVGMADNGRIAVDAIRTLNPDLVFLDMQMPGLTGLQVVRTVGPDRMPATIFVTAYDQFALQAFDASALDYLVKPFDDERFDQALARARRWVELERIGELTDHLRTLLDVSGAPPATAVPLPSPTPGESAVASHYIERIAVELRGQIRIVPVGDIDAITASGSYVELHVAEKTFLLRERMQVLEEKLDPSQFLRIHRSAIVRLSRIEALTRDPGGDYSVRLKSGAELPVSRNRVEQLERWVGLGG